MTGQIWVMKRASEMPPSVESSGRLVVSASTASESISSKTPGSVMKLSPEFLKTKSYFLPGMASVIVCVINSLSVSPVWRSLNLILNLALADAGITFVAVLPTHKRERIVRAIRIGHMALFAVYCERAIEAASAAQFDGVSHF